MNFFSLKVKRNLDQCKLPLIRFRKHFLDCFCCCGVSFVQDICTVYSCMFFFPLQITTVFHLIDIGAGSQREEEED
jgi:hypothetical protein